MEWNISGIANSVIHEMTEDNADINDLEYYLKDVFRSIQSREPDKAELVIAQVREYIENNCPEG